MKKERLREIIIIASSILLAFLFSLSTVGKLFDMKIYDLLFTIKPKPKVWDRILYVAIDNQSIDEQGRWPWPRSKVAQGVTMLKELGAEKILFDIEFIDATPKILNNDNLQQIEQYYQNLTFKQLAPSLIIDADKELYESFIYDNNTNVYLAGRGVSETKKVRSDIDNAYTWAGKSFESVFFVSNTRPELEKKMDVNPFMEYPVYPLYYGARGIGSTAIDYDADGVVRKVVLFHLHKGFLVPQLVLPVLFDELDIDKEKTVIVPGRHVILQKRNGEKITIPVTISNEMYINFPGKWAKMPFGPVIPFTTLLQLSDMKKDVEDNMELAQQSGMSAEAQEILAEGMKQLQEGYTLLSNVRGKIVIIGASAESASDIGPIPFESSAPLMIAHGSIMNTIYQKAFLTPANGIINWLFVLAVSGILFLTGIKIKAALPEIFLSLGLLVTIFIAYIIFISNGLILDYSFLTFSALLSFMAIIGSKFILYDQQKNQIKNTFMQYLSPDVVKQLVENPELATLGGERKEITAYFSDVQGFTSISEGLSPEQLVHLLNEYLTAMTDIILSHGGTVDKYEGDAIVAFFGAPIPHKDHAIRCCRAAVDMQKKLVELREHWKQDGFPTILSRMGMNTGQAVVGNMGSQQRMDYTMMGDTVNLASRLEGANKAYGSFTMISQTTYEYVKDDFLTRKLDLLQVVGKSEPIAVYELIDRRGHADQRTIDILNGYNEALLEYEKRNWEEAMNKFDRIAKEYDDAPSATYAQRCLKFKRKAPPTDWNGVYVLKSK